MSFRRMLPFLLINVVISAVVVLAILYWWDNRTAETAATADMAPTVGPIVAEIPGTPVVAGAEVQNNVVAAPEETAGEPLVHTVQAGETLGSISRFYEVPLEDIVTVNNIANPNVLAVGQQLVIPVGGIPTATPVPTEQKPTPETSPVPIPTEPPETAGEAVVEISDVIGVGQLTEEAVQILNSGSRQVGLLDWQVIDEDGHVYTFGQVTLFGDGAGILVHTEAGQDAATDLYWGLEEPVWQSGEAVTLLNKEGEVQATFTVP